MVRSDPKLPANSSGKWPMDTRTSNLPLIVLFSLFLLLFIGTLYPSAAYPVHGLGGAFVLLLLLLPTAAFSPQEETFLPGKKWLCYGLLIGPVLWGLLWIYSLTYTPVYTIGRDTALNSFISVVGFVIAFYVMSSWSAEDFQESSQNLSPLYIIATLLTCLGGFLGLYGIYQVYGPQGLPQTYASMIANLKEYMPDSDPMKGEFLAVLEEGRASGPFGASNIYASFLAATLPFAVALATVTRKRHHAAGAVVVTIAIIGGLILSGSRGGFLAAVAGVVTLSVLSFGWYIHCKIRRSVLYGIAGLLCILVAIAVAFLISQNLSSESRLLNASGLNQRLYYWTTALEIWPDAPLMGMGAGAFEIYYPQYRQQGANETQHPHSWFFLFGTSLGIVGLGMFILIVAIGTMNGELFLRYLQREKKRKQYILMASLMASGVALLAHGSIEYTFSHREASLLFFIVFGLWTGVGANSMTIRPSKKCEDWAYRRAIFPVTIFFGGCAITLVNLTPDVRGYLAIQHAENALLSEAPAAEIINAYNNAINVDPLNASHWAARGNFRVRLRRPTAENDFKEAQRLNPYSAQIQEDLARYYANNGDFERAIMLQHEAIDLHPVDPSHRLTLAEMYLQLDELEKAQEVLDHVSMLKIGRVATSERFEMLREQVSAATTPREVDQ